MRFKSKKQKNLEKLEKLKDIKQKTFFAWLPVTIKGQTRWLETVTVKGYYFVGAIFHTLQFNETEFIDPNTLE